jgi:hypothetical protein
VDVYVYSSGEWLSATVRRSLAVLFDPATPGLTPHERACASAGNEIAGFAALVNARKDREALAAFDALPAEVRADKTLLLTRLQVAHRLGPEGEPTLREAVQDLRRAFPDDPCGDMVQIEGARWGQVAEALAAVDRLERRVGGDPHLENVRGQIRKH